MKLDIEDYMAMALTLRKSRDYYRNILIDNGLDESLGVDLSLGCAYDGIEIPESVFEKSVYARSFGRII